MHKFLVPLVSFIDLASKFNIRKGPGQWEAKVFSEDGQEIAEIKKGEGSEFRMLDKRGNNNHEWVLTNKIDGEHRRFSFSVRRVEKKEKEEETEKAVGGSSTTTATAGDLLTVRNNVFKHNGKFYMIANHPAGKLWQDHITSPIRYISRLDNFPYSDISELDQNELYEGLRQKLKRFRGVPVGEASGLGTTPEGHNVKVNDELDEIGLFIAAVSYLMYATA